MAAHCSGCVFTAVCVCVCTLDGLNPEHKFQVWVTILGHRSLSLRSVCKYDIVFVGAVALAGADSGLWAVDGGNKMVCSGLLNHSKAELVPARVTAISMKMRPPKAGTFIENIFIYCVHCQQKFSSLGSVT